MTQACILSPFSPFKKGYVDLKKNNKLLYSHFSELYCLVIDALSNFVNKEVSLTKTLALPGFHIFKSAPQFLLKGGDWHKDLTHKTLNLKGDSPCSFTLPIKIPTGGAGIDYIGGDLTPKFLDYKVGNLVLHNGLIPHRISKLKKYCKNEYRITMQGHLITINNKTEAYF